MSSNENNSLRIYFSSKSDTEDDFTRKNCFFNEPVYADEKLIRLKNSKKENCNTCANNAQESTNWNAYSGLLLGITTKYLQQLKKNILNFVWEPFLYPVREPFLNPVWEPFLCPIWEPILNPVWETFLNPLWEPF